MTVHIPYYPAYSTAELHRSLEQHNEVRAELAELVVPGQPDYDLHSMIFHHTTQAELIEIELKLRGETLED